MIKVKEVLEMLNECDPEAIAFVRFVDEKGETTDEELEGVVIEKAVGKAGYVMFSSTIPDE